VGALAGFPVGVAVVAFGLILGSFTNVLIHRIPRRRSVVFPPSACPSCRARIRWYDNVPLLSYLLLRGRCRSCKAPIPVRYPVVELLVASLVYAAYARFGASAVLLVRDWPFMVMLVAITFIDLDRRIIPDRISLPGLALGIATSFLVPSPGPVEALSGAALGFALFYGLARAYEWKAGRVGLGGGDVKLIAMIGAFVGPQGVIATILISSVLGSLIGVGWALATRQRSVMGAAIPFGPFLVIGGLYYYLLGELIWFPSMTPT
jgi:leader peptidase (prepilin peptidase)/N-methyltransferase